jgi:hypothetical protein
MNGHCKAQRSRIWASGQGRALIYGTWADQVRIGSLTSGGEDKWWRLVRGAEVDPVRDDALADLLTYGVPWLREHTTS